MLTPQIAAMMGKKLEWKVKLRYLDLDIGSGHVKVQVREEEPFWVPYVILHAGCSKERKKARLNQVLQSLMSKMPLLMPYPSWEFPKLQRLNVIDMHPIVLLHYWPEFRDGTMWGEHERVMYRLAGTQTVGVAMLKDVREWYRVTDQAEVLETFVKKKRVSSLSLSLYVLQHSFYG